MKLMAHKYGLGKPLDWGSDCDQQMIAANNLWNKLVEIERAHIVTIRQIIGANTVVSQLAQEIETLKTELGILKIQRKQFQKEKRDLTTITPSIKQISDQLTVLYPLYKNARKASSVDNKLLLQEASNARFAAVKAARQAAAGNGLWWGNYNAVIDSFETAADKARKTGAELHFRRYTGEGRITNQIQGGMTVAQLFSGEHSQVQIIDANPTQSDKRRYHLVTTVFSENRVKRMVRFPLVLHRPLPENAMVQMVVVHRRMEFDRPKWTVVFNLRVAEPEIDNNSESVVAVNFGWRKIDESIRVATITRNNHTDFIMMPAKLLAGQAAGERNQSRMDDEVNRMSEWLSKLDIRFANATTQEIVAKLRSFKHIRGNHFEWLRETWEINSPAWFPQGLTELAELQAFGKKWRRYKRDDADGRQWLQDARQYHYRAEVRRVIGNASVIVMNEHDMSETARTDGNDLPQAARHQRTLAAPSLLRYAMIEYAQKIGARIVVDDSKHDVCVCHGVSFAQLDRAKLLWTCAVTHLGLDQDVDYCRAMFNRFCATDSVIPIRTAEPVKTPTIRANRKRAQAA